MKGSPDRPGPSMDRREFLAASAGLAVTAASGAPAGDVTRWDSSPGLDRFIEAKMARDHIPGVVACLVRDDRIAWSNSYGWSDLEREIPMDLDRLQNIASISKTFTTAAVLQLYEDGSFGLDDDVGDYLPFPVRHPEHPNRTITFRHLMTHVSSITDGREYSMAYGCGDPRTSLGDWMAGYLTPGGEFYAAENFHPWQAGGNWAYCNVSYGLLAYLVENISGQAFADYCRENVFARAGMNETAWYLSEIDPSRHSIPYTWVSGGEARGPSWGGLSLGVIRDRGPGPATIDEGYEANCFYNHPNFPDGFLRTSVRQLARWARVHLRGGELDGQRILAAKTVEAALTGQVTAGGRMQGLTWYGQGQGKGRVRGQVPWGHGGSDPGVNTDIRLLPNEGIAAIVFMNTNGADPAEVTMRILEEAPEL